VRYLGASSMAAWQFAKAQQIAGEHGWTRFVSMQNHYNLAYREEEREMIPLCRDQRVAVIPWSPLARGFLAGNRGTTDASRSATIRAQTDDVAQKYYGNPGDLRVLEQLGQLALQKGVSNATLAYAWLLRKGVTAPIVGATNLSHIEQAVAALDSLLTDEDVALLEAPYEPHRVIGHS
jgi:1-deoxyxylulose-5-phosphate synthase